MLGAARASQFCSMADGLCPISDAQKSFLEIYTKQVKNSQSDAAGSNEAVKANKVVLKEFLAL